MEYYVYLIIVFAVLLKIGFYMCWYQSRRNRDNQGTLVRVIMPDGSVRNMAVRGRAQAISGQVSRNRTIYQYDNPVQVVSGEIPTTTTSRSTVAMPSTVFQNPPSYPATQENKSIPDDLPPAYSELYHNRADNCVVAAPSGSLVQQSTYGIENPPAYCPSTQELPAFPAEIAPPQPPVAMSQEATQTFPETSDTAASSEGTSTK
ncbi:uncharacterized protein LOC102805431 [Saccoglossus kowalevskii]|uniref:Uncharacterized protein LOC102805431 n=1 Tax=Saccoglossus kowalevskii TaxID=10224 RepID=A0ABM0MEF8_SACKO|nr:PREDICTED: uncharacterized protein LOC102805431 [Saccoglossus kowalevskii]